MRNILKTFGLISDLPGIKLLLISAVVVSFLDGLAGIAQPYIFKLIIDRVVAFSAHPGQSFTPIFWLLVFLVVLGAFSALMDYLDSFIGNWLFFRVVESLRIQTFAALQKLSLDFFETQKVGELFQKLNQAINDFTQWLNALTSGPLTQLTTLLLALVIIWAKSWQAGAVISLIIPLNVYLTIRNVRFSKNNRLEGNKLMERASGHAYENISNAATVRSFANESASLSYLTDLLGQWRRLRMSRVVYLNNGDYIRRFLSSAAIAAGIGIITVQAVHGKYTAGDIFLVALYLQQITGSLPSLGRMIVQIGDVETSAQRLIEVMEAAPTVADKPDALEAEAFESLEFRRVSFRYPGKSTRVLRDVSFAVKKGQTVALVGPSGVGKTTITKLIMRFYDPTSGKILLNGRDLRDYKQESVRRMMAAVMQDVALFNDTIEANLRFAAPDAKRPEIVEASKRAHADEFINELPDKYKTLVGERGIKLSGGQKQRVAITRAILRDPQLIILDEATSALDSESERLVQEGMRDLMDDRSAVVIAHRLSTVMRADTILVLRSGRVIEKGTHVQLVKKAGLYAKLFKLQTAHPLEVV